MRLSDLASDYISSPSKLTEGTTEKNIIEFCEAPWGLNLGSPGVPALPPALKFIFKCYYNIPLLGGSPDIIIRDKFNEKERFRFTEIEYLSYLYNEGRINIKALSEDPNDVRPKLVLVVGRRGLKTTGIAAITAYETYKLLRKKSPQEYYGIMPDDEIRVTCIATEKDQAAELFRRITGHLENSDYFARYRDKPTLNYMRLNTQRDLDKHQGNRPSLRIVAAACSGRGLRGRNNIIAILDEMSFFFDKENSKDRSDDSVYEAVTPSTAGFNSPNGIPEGKIICISSPGPCSGKFHEMYKRSFDPKCEDILMIQAPTWEINPSISPKYLRAKCSENPITYNSEFGADFSDTVSAWIDNEQLLRMNIIPGLKEKTHKYQQVPHFMGIDVGLKNDGTAVSICHIEKKEVGGSMKDCIELDWIEVRYAIDEGKEFFRPEDMALWILECTKKFFIVKGFMDQYYGMAIVPVLFDKGIKQIETFQSTRDFNSRVYQNLMSKMLDGTLRIPEGKERIVGDKKTKDLDLVTEMLKLRAVQHSKYIISVQAPDVKGAHDDLSDAFARSVYLATEYLGKMGSTGRDFSSRSNNPSMSYRKYYKRSKAASDYTRRPSSSLQLEGSRRSFNSSLASQMRRI